MAPATELGLDLLDTFRTSTVAPRAPYGWSQLPVQIRRRPTFLLPTIRRMCPRLDISPTRALSAAVLWVITRGIRELLPTERPPCPGCGQARSAPRTVGFCWLLVADHDRV